MFSNLPECSEMFPIFLKHPRMFSNLPECSEMFPIFPKHPRMFSNFPECSRICLGVLDCCCECFLSEIGNFPKRETRTRKALSRRPFPSALRNDRYLALYATTCSLLDAIWAIHFCFCFLKMFQIKTVSLSRCALTVHLTCSCLAKP